MHFALRLILVAPIPIALLLGPAAAQQSSRPWRAAARAEVEVRFDRNPFLLTDGRRERLEDVSTADSQSGRFRDMERAADLIPALALRAGGAGAGMAGRPLELELDVVYEANLLNAARRHAEFGFRAAQSLPRGGRLRLLADWRPSYFHKNYLLDAVDQDLDGLIGPGERVYAAGRSNELEIGLAYRRRLMRSESRAMTLLAEVEVGYERRAYDAPFGGRTRGGPAAAAGLTVELASGWRVGVEYGLALLGADPAQEVLILNENDFGQDFNGNLTTTDDSARASVAVDRSRTEHAIALSLRGAMGKSVDLDVGFRRRQRNFGSREPFDVVNRDRRDVLHEIDVALDARLLAGLHLMAGARHGVQSTNRAADPGSSGDETDYTRQVLYSALSYRF